VLPVSTQDEYARIRRYVAGFARDPAEADDLAQDVFLRAHRARDELRDPQARLGWLYSIATHLCTDRLRQRMRAPLDSGTSPDDLDVADAAPPLQQVMEQADMSACVQRYLTDLPDSYRAALLLHDLEGLAGLPNRV
jgi:RNA polymerase sigma-70 factor, ECF subfamily